MDTQQNDTDFDLFDRAFDAAVTDLPLGEEPAVEKVTDGNAAAEGQEAPASVDETPAGDAAEQTAMDKAIESPVTDKVVTQSTGDYQRQTVELLEELVKKGTSPGPADAAQPNAQTPATSQDESGADPEPFKLSDEQTALLKTFDDEWPEIAKASALRTEIAVRTALGGLVKQLRTELAPLVSHYAKNAGDSHLGTIRGKHEDFDTLKPKLLEWIGKQPAGLRNAYVAIAKDGSAEDVVELIDTYKKVHGITSQPQEPSTEASVTPAKKPAPEVQKAAASLAVIPGRRAVVPKAGVDKNDFDGAWGEATAA